MSTDKKTDGPTVQANGLPIEWSEAANIGKGNSIIKMGFVMTIIESAIGVGIATAIHMFGASHKYDAKLAILAGMELKPLYLVPSLFYLLGNFATFNMCIHRSTAPCDAPDQYIYKVANQDMPYVLLEKDGIPGKFNRAMRATGNIGEYAPLMLASALLGGFVYPFPMTVAFGLYCGLRALYTVQYTGSAEGRGLGFATSQHLVAPAMIGMTFLAFLKM